MKFEFDPDADALYIKLDAAPKGGVEKTSEVAKGIYLDYGRGGKVLGIEVLNVSYRLKPGDFQNLSSFLSSLHAYLTVEEVAGLLRADPETIRRKIRRKEISAINLGGRAGYRISSSQIFEPTPRKLASRRQD